MASSHSLIFLHGWGTDSSVWKNQVEHFSKLHRVMTPVIARPEGPKQSQKRDCFASSPSGTSLAMTSDFLLSSIQHPVSSILIGWSYGGVLAMELAAKEPTKYKALVLIGSSAKFTDGMNPVIVKNLRRNLIRDYETTMRNCYGTFFSVGEANFIGDFVKRQGLPDKKETIEVLDKLARLDLKGVLKDIHIPVLIIHGDKDEICPIQSGEYLYKNIRNSRFEIIKGAGHMPFYTRHKEFNKILEGFLADVLG